ncbi:MAG: hypothetical protein DELT_01725 [Desulfovibrio sp.]
MSVDMTPYRAKADCRAGGFYRRKGETFVLPTFPRGDCPSHLEAVEEAVEAVAAEAKTKTKKAKV